jgi:hypothetical protein
MLLTPQCAHVIGNQSKAQQIKETSHRENHHAESLQEHTHRADVTKSNFERSVCEV